MCQGTKSADGLQKEWVEGVQQQRFIDEGHGDQTEAGDPEHARQRRAIDRQRRAKQQVQQVQTFAGDAEDQHTAGKGDRVDRGEAGVFPQAGATGDPGGESGHAETGTEAADGQCRQTQSSEPEAQCGPRQNAVSHRVANQTHPSQDQKYAQRCGAACQNQPAEKCSTHEHELVERLPKMSGREHQATRVWGCWWIRSTLDPRTQPVLLISNV